MRSNINLLDILTVVLVALKLTGNADNLTWGVVFIPFGIGILAVVLRRHLK